MLPTQRPVSLYFPVLHEALTPPAGSTTTRGGVLTAGAVTTSVNSLGYAEGEVDYFVDDVWAGRRTFSIGRTYVSAGATFLEGIAVSFDLTPAFQRQGIASTLHRNIVAALRAAGVERILVDADRVGATVWQRYYELNHEYARSNGDELVQALFAMQPKLDHERQAALRAYAIRAASGRVRGVPLRMRMLPTRPWPDIGEPHRRIGRYLAASHRIADIAAVEGRRSAVSELLGVTHWKGVACLNERAAAHNEALRQAALTELRK